MNLLRDLDAEDVAQDANENRHHTSMVEVALGLLAQGFRPIPIEPNGKKPLVKWQEFQKHPPTERDLRQWFSKWPAANVAILTGAPSGVDVLDFDPGHDPWPPAGCELPAGCVIETPRGGLHYYFAHVVGVRNSMSVLARHVDVRGDGGYILIPPSTVNGNGYTIRHGSLVQARETPAPDWLRSYLLNGASQKIPMTARVTGDKRIPEGQRNAVLTSLAGTMRRRGMTPEAILRALLTENTARCDPPLLESEVREIAQSVGRYSPAEPPALFALTDLGNAERFAAQRGKAARYVQNLGWLVWDGKVWRRNPGAAERLAKLTVRSIYNEAASASSQEQREAVGKWALKSESHQKIDALLNLARSEMVIAADATLFDRDPYLLNCANGILDLRSGELKPHRADACLTRLAGAEHHPDAACPTWLEFLDRIFASNADLVAFVQRAAGYTLTSDTGERCLFFCYGTGANGKSTLLETLRAVFGDYAAQADVESFLAQRDAPVRNDLARLAGVRLVCAVEAGEGRRLAEGLIKQLTGNDTVSARFLYHEHFEFKPQFKLWLAANHKPTIRGTDNAVWDRIRLIPFMVTIPEAGRDPHLLERLRVELPGILAWAVQGALAWQRDGGLHPPKEVRAATQSYRAEMDILANFLADCSIVGPLAEVTAAALYKAYADWSERNGERPMSQMAFSLRIAEKGFDKQRGRTGAMIWRGLGLEQRS